MSRPDTKLFLWDEYLPWYQMHRTETTYRDMKYTGACVKKYIGKFSAEDLSAHHLNLYKQMRLSEAKSTNKSGLNRTGK